MEQQSISVLNSEWISVIRVKVNDQFTNLLLDTGANRSAINAKLAERWRLNIDQNIENSPTSLYTANGEAMNNKGTVLLQINVDGKNLEQRFIVLDKLTTNLIAGCDFMREHNAIVDMKEGVAIFNKSQKVPLIHKKEFIGLARLKTNLKLKPGERIVTAVHVQRKPEDEVYLLNLPDATNGMKVITAKYKTGDAINVILHNDSQEQVEMRKNDPVACCVLALECNKSLMQEVKTETKEEKKERVQRKQPHLRTIEDLELQINKDGYVKEDISEFTEVIQENIDMFAMSNSELPGCTLMKATFKLKDQNCKPVRGRLFNHSKEARNEIERQVAQLLKDDFIERSCSPFSSSVMLVKKSDGSQRMVQDNRPINKLLEEEIFVPNTLSEIVERVGAERPKLFSSVDLRSAYQQIEIEEGPSRDYCAFVCHLGHFTFKRMSFGIQSAPAKFMKLMSMVLGEDEILQRNCIPYLDDLLLFSKNLKEHTDLLRRLFNRLREAGLKVHPGKCEFLQQSVKYVGHIFSDKGIAPDRKKLSAILDFPRPTTKKNLKGFLGMVSFYRGYHAGLSKKVSPLLILLKKDQRFVWTKECEESFQEIRNGLKDMPVLTYPDEEPDAGRYIIQVDASQFAIAGTFSQVDKNSGEERLIACYGRSLRPNEKNWPICDKEGAALMLALLRWKHLILGNPGLEIRSDNMSVTFLERINHATSPRLARWSTAMSPLLAKATWTHIAGTKNIVPDILSRQEYPPEEPMRGEEDLLYDDMTFGTLHDDVMEFWDEEEDGVFEEGETSRRWRELDDYWFWSGGKLEYSGVADEWDEIEELYLEDERITTDNDIWICYDNDHEPDELEEMNFIQQIKESIAHTTQLRIKEETVNNLTEIASNETLERTLSQTTRTGVEICAGNGKDFIHLQRECSEIGPLLKYLEDGDLKDNSMKNVRKILNQAEWHFLDEEGVLCSTAPRMTARKNASDETYRVVPVILRQDVLSGFHQFGHCGINRLQELILKAGYKWERLYIDVRNYVLSCKACATAKRGVIAPRARLKPLEIPERPGDVLQIDILGPYSVSSDGHTAVLSVIDRLTSYVWLYPLKTCSSDVIANKLFKVFADIGIPKILISDNGTNLVSKTMQEMAGRLGIKHIHVAPYHSQSNGKIERAHRTIQDNLRALLCGGDHTKWNQKLPEIVWGLRSAVSSITKRSPYELRHGHQMRLPIDRILEPATQIQQETEKTKEESAYSKNLTERMDLIHRSHKLKLEEEQEITKKIYDDKIQKLHKYKLGEKVYLKDPTGITGISKKLQTVYYPDCYEITEIHNDHNVKIKNTTTQRELSSVIHVDRLKPVVDRLPPRIGKGAAVNTTESASAVMHDLPHEPIEPKTDLNGKKEMGKQTAANSASTKPNKKTTLSTEVEYKIVEQKGSGENRRFRVQWRNSAGRSESCWDDIRHVTPEMLGKWEKTHGKTGKTLMGYRKTRKK